MKAWAITILRLYRAAYYVFASLYCFLAFIPYTYLFVVVNPPYRWMDTFARHNVLLLWIAVAASAVSQWGRISHGAVRVMMAAEFALAVIISIHSPISNIHGNSTALVWSIVFLLPPAVSAAYDLIQRVDATGGENRYSSIAYSDAIYIGLLTGLISIAAPRLQGAIRAGFLLVQLHDAELMFWVIVEHVTLAIAIASAINLMRAFLVRRIRNAYVLNSGVIGIVVFAGLGFGCLQFIQDSLSLRGWAAGIFSFAFAATLTICGLALPGPIFNAQRKEKIHRWLPGAIAILLVALSIYVSLAIDPNDDWNGIVHKIFTLLLWVALAFGISRARSLQKQYSIITIVGVALVTCGAYEALNHSKPVWAADVGRNKAEILREISNYSATNTSFGLVDGMLGNQQAEPCDANCKTLRQYSNIRNATISRELKLVENLSPASGPKPNIFIIVIDSLRPDYLGAYNPRVDFTPNIDAFARDSVTMRSAYSNYAGTSLSEPAIWSGALLLHSHYAQPFQKVNSLEKLARADGYQMVVSYDEILRELLTPSSDLVKLDTDKKAWGQIELSSTMRQLEDFLDHRPAQAPPVLFYTQAMNVQIHAQNDLPKRTGQNWKTREGFDDRIAYTLHQTDEFFGQFIAYLKSKNLYENSIIVVTADHGDATGELGRRTHSTIIYPEVMRVPLIVHLPQNMRGKYSFDESRISTLTDIAPSLYYLLGHRPTQSNPLVGRPMFMQSADEFLNYPRPDLLLASDSLAAYGILSGDGRWMYTTYDSPSRSMLFDLLQDPNAQHNVLTPELKKQNDDRILQYLQLLSKFYGHQPTGG
jgi:glucan phosphoethanolaminetransferase (alkaline phosphatase superfamily)